MAYLPTSGNERGRKGRLIHKHTIPIGRGQHSFCGACFWGSNPHLNGIKREVFLSSLQRKVMVAIISSSAYLTKLFGLPQIWI
jgi:hypothetical protein